MITSIGTKKIGCIAVLVSVILIISICISFSPSSQSDQSQTRAANTITTTIAEMGTPICYKDSNNRILNGAGKNIFNDNTPEKCSQFCKKSGFDVSGVQYASECFCGTSMPEDSLKLDRSACNMACSGDSSKLCGGTWTISIIQNVDKSML